MLRDTIATKKPQYPKECFTLEKVPPTEGEKEPYFAEKNFQRGGQRDSASKRGKTRGGVSRDEKKGPRNKGTPRRQQRNGLDCLKKTPEEEALTCDKNIRTGGEGDLPHQEKKNRLKKKTRQLTRRGAEMADTGKESDHLTK